MTTTKAESYNSLSASPQVLQAGVQGYGNKLVIFRAKITYASQAAADDIQLFKVPAGMLPVLGVLNADTSSGSTTIAIGISGTTAKYKAAAAFTATDTPTLFGKWAAVGGVTPLTATETWLATLAAATAPASGGLTIDAICASL